MLEIYNEQVRDLLRPPGAAAERLEITSATGESVVKGLERRRVTSADEVEFLITAGSRHRAAGAHALNKDSSRSHSIVTLYIRGETAAGEPISSKLHLVDLAGSERLDKTGATGDRLTEAKAINKSLSALGDVVAALSSGRRGHVPFRNSKLTYLLQDSLSGDSKALMFVNARPAARDLRRRVAAAPTTAADGSRATASLADRFRSSSQVSTDADDVSETLCSLKFAARCQDVALGAARRNAGPAASRTPRTPERRT